MKKDIVSIEYVKSLGKNRCEKSFDELLKLFFSVKEIDVRREVVSSIGRQNDIDRIVTFIEEEGFNDNNPMELVYQMYRTCLYKGKTDDRLRKLGEKIRLKYNNENIEKMKSYFDYKQKKIKRNRNKNINKPLLLVGDAEETLKNVPKGTIQLGFTSPPYYNAREYSNYHSYNEYLEKIKGVFCACNRVIEDGRFFIVNISPVITKRPGREFESIRYPIPYDFHKILEESGFYFVDEIIWIKPEPSVPNRVGGYQQTRRPLSYKPNCITESIMVYRKKCSYLLDKNIHDYDEYVADGDDEIDTTNCWYIAPKSDKNHPAVFPEELCKRILKYYSYENDVVLDPFAGIGTFGRVAHEMNRIPVMCEINEEYAKIIEEKGAYYDIRRRCDQKHSK